MSIGLLFSNPTQFFKNHEQTSLSFTYILFLIVAFFSLIITYGLYFASSALFAQGESVFLSSDYTGEIIFQIITSLISYIFIPFITSAIMYVSLLILKENRNYKQLLKINCISLSVVISYATLITILTIVISSIMKISYYDSLLKGGDSLFYYILIILSFTLSLAAYIHGIFLTITGIQTYFQTKTGSAILAGFVFPLIVYIIAYFAIIIFTFITVLIFSAAFI